MGEDVYKTVEKIQKNRSSMKRGFKLLSLELLKNKELGSIWYDFLEEGDDFRKPYKTALIGPNGTGKSNLLRTIIQLFRQIYDYQNYDGVKNSFVNGGFYLTYEVDNVVFEYTNIIEDNEGDTKAASNSWIIKINGSEKGHNQKKYTPADLALPKTIVANSMMLTDKFPFVKNEHFTNYKYLGVRNTPQQASTASFMRRTVEFVANSIDSEYFIGCIERISDEYLEQDFYPFIEYKTQNSALFFSGSLNESDFSDYYTEIFKRYQDKTISPPYKVDYYMSTIAKDNDLTEEIIDFCNQLHHSTRLHHIRRSPSKHIRYNLLNEQELGQLRYEFKMLEYLRRLGIISTPDIRFRPKKGLIKEDSGYYLDESSSGEYNLISSLIGLIASVSKNTLVLIDEPEVSLHPNWQMKYFDMLDKLFSDDIYSSCHFIVATHSHFLISDLKGANSKIIGLRKEQRRIISLPIKSNLDTYGWSSEQVLLEIFNAPTTRNRYVADRIGDILELISAEHRDDMLISKKVTDLLEQKVLKLSSSDPLHSVWNKLVEKYG